MTKILALLLLTLALCGCQIDLDADLARICRTTIPALEDEQSTITILSQSGRRVAAQDLYQVTVTYQTQLGQMQPGQTPQKHQLICQFSPDSAPDPRDRLIGLIHDHLPRSDVQLFMMKRFWLGYGSSSLSDPEPIIGLNHAPELHFVLAYALQHALNALPLAVIYALLALAYSLIYGLLGRINLAFGEMAAIGGSAAIVTALAVTNLTAATVFFCALLAGLYAAGIHGAVLSRLAFLPLSRATGQQALVGTIGLAVALQEYLRLAQGNEQRWSPPLFHNPLALAKAGPFAVTLSPIMIFVTLIGAAAALAVLLLMTKTQFGRQWRAYSDDPFAAELFGISPQRLFLQSFILASACAGLAGAALALYFGGLGFGQSTALGLKALIAAILGGIGSIPGALLGGALVALIETLWSAYFQIDYRELVLYALLAVFLIFRPGGLTNMVDIPRRKL